MDAIFQLIDQLFGFGLVIFLFGCLMGAFRKGSQHDPGGAGTLN